MSSDWEVFASMLVTDLGRKFGAGIDSVNYEVKPAKRGSSYEYQYHNTSHLRILLIATLLTYVVLTKNVHAAFC